MKCNIKGCQSYDESHDNNCNNKLVYMYLNKACYRLKEEERIKMTPPPPPQHPKPEKLFIQLEDLHETIIRISAIKGLRKDIEYNHILHINGKENKYHYNLAKERDLDYDRIWNLLSGLTEE